MKKTMKKEISIKIDKSSKIKDEPSKEEILNSLKNAIEEVNSGSIFKKNKTAEELLDEL